MGERLRHVFALLGLLVALVLPLPAGSAPAGDVTGPEAAPGTASNGSVEVVVVRAGPSGQERATPIVSGSGTAFSDCPSPDCPMMLVVPTSEPGLVLGEIDGGDHDKRLRGIAIKSFAIGKTEVSVAEYDRCVAEGACRQPEWREPGSQFHIETGRNAYYKTIEPGLSAPGRPIVGVSHADAVAYADWLSKLTGRAYRLPSETEWEYAARAGTQTTYWWGSSTQRAGQVMAACRGCGSEWDAKTNAPVSSFPPNAWGVEDMHGNVWEWTADYYCNDFSSSPRDGSPRATDDCPVRDAPDLRVLRGGSSFYEPRFMTSATRLRNVSGFRNFSVGFRVARTLP
jgi:formylglycine-generating enzyme required for sulfatase activity